jgi:hypothetical protein
MSQRQALCHDMVCHINRYHIITQYATTISMSLQHELSHIKNNHYNIINHFLHSKFLLLQHTMIWYIACCSVITIVPVVTYHVIIVTVCCCDILSIVMWHMFFDHLKICFKILLFCPPVSSTCKTDRHEITEILLKVVLNIIKQTNEP